jgi:hypothetical protein
MAAPRSVERANASAPRRALRLRSSGRARADAARPGSPCDRSARPPRRRPPLVGPRHRSAIATCAPQETGESERVELRLTDSKHVSRRLGQKKVRPRAPCATAARAPGSCCGRWPGPSRPTPPRSNGRSRSPRSRPAAPPGSARCRYAPSSTGRPSRHTSSGPRIRNSGAAVTSLAIVAPAATTYERAGATRSSDVGLPLCERRSRLKIVVDARAARAMTHTKRKREHDEHPNDRGRTAGHAGAG